MQIVFIKSCFSSKAPSITIMYYNLPVTVSVEVADTTTTWPSRWRMKHRPVIGMRNAGA